VSATTTTLIGPLDSARWPAAGVSAGSPPSGASVFSSAVSPAGGPSGKALGTVPVIRAAIDRVSPSGKKSLSMDAGSGKPCTLVAGTNADWSVVVDQRRERRGGVLGQREGAGGCEVDPAQVARDRVVGVHLLGARVEPDDVGHDVLARARGADGDREIEVADELGAVVGDAPRAEEVGQVAGAVLPHRHAHLLGDLLGFGDGVDEDDRAAPAEDVLVDRIDEALGQVLGMNDHQRVEPARQFGRVGGIVSTSKVAPSSRSTAHSGVGRCVRGSKPAGHRQARQQAERGLVGLGELRDELGDAVLEEAFFLGRKRGMTSRPSSAFVATSPK
jgi:hypothetical protein